MYGLIVFLAGMTVMMLEIAGMRIITPYFGSSFIVSTSTIGIILAFLSLGYWFGGKLSDKCKSMRILSTYVFGAGLYTLITSFFQFKVLYAISTLTDLNIIITSILASIFLFAIPSVLFGLVSPYVVNFVLSNHDDNTKSGAMVGRLYALSTLGSILGTFLCGFYLILYFGLEVISFFISFCIFMCSFLCLISDKEQRRKSFLRFSVSSFVLMSFFFAVYFKLNNFKITEKSIYTKTTPYQYLFVEEDYWDDEKVIMLKDGLGKKFEHMAQSLSFIDRLPENQLMSYHENFYYIFDKKKKKNEILILGNGAGVFLNAIVDLIKKKSLTNINIDVVEIDRIITEIAKKYFGMTINNNTEIFHEDARTFLNRKAKKKDKYYDLVFFDVYKGGPYFPSTLVTKESIVNIQSILDKDGLLAMNVIASARKEPFRSNLNQIYTQVSSVFNNVKVFAIGETGDPDKLDSIFSFVLVASNDNIEKIIKEKEIFPFEEYKFVEKTNEVYTDKYYPYEKILLKEYKKTS